MAEKMIAPGKVSKNLVLAIRKWDTFVATRTLNGYLVSESENPSLDRSIVTTEMAFLEDYLEIWASAKLRICKDDDDEDDSGG